MRLTPSQKLRPRLAFATLAALVVSAVPAGAQTPPAAPPPADDPLGNIVVVAGAGRPLPKIAVLPSIAPDLEDVTLRNVVTRDLDLSGEFEVLPDSAAPDGLYLSDSPIDIKAWSAKGVEAVVKVVGRKSGKDQAELRAQAYLLKSGQTPVFDKGFLVPAAEVRLGAHRIADLVIGALTGQNGGFASHMAFANGGGTSRRIFTLDADGHDAKAVSPVGHVVLAPAFGKNEELYYSASVDNDVYRIFSAATGKPVDLPIRGSVYGLAFSRDRAQVAVSIGVGDTIKLFTGRDFGSIAPASTVGLVIRPTFTPSGKLAFSGEGKSGQRIYVDGKPISPDGMFASSPVFCNHPDGVRAVFAVGVGKDTDLVATSENGGQMMRLTQNQGSNGYPACSPDGRLVAFFSTRKSNEGPGLYIMRIDGARPKRVSTLLGDSLRWEAVPVNYPERARP